MNAAKLAILQQELISDLNKWFNTEEVTLGPAIVDSKTFSVYRFISVNRTVVYELHTTEFKNYSDLFTIVATEVYKVLGKDLLYQINIMRQEIKLQS